MRQRRASASNGILDKRVRLSHQTFLLAAMAVIGLWMVGSLAQEISLNQSLSRQSADLRDRNAALRATNDQYRKDIAAVSSGAAAEEEARKDGYARSDEKLYLIATPPPATPAPVAAKQKPASSSSGSPFDALRHMLLG
ncbi:MAG TPA: septum formation initiator family protein [Candidatus Dormibacteraeota bacterium]|jgi:cell division protein FtsB